jgi:chromate reductase
MKALVIAGASRKGSNTWKVSQAIGKTFINLNVETHIQSFEEYDIPFFNKGFLNKAALSPFQEELIRHWAESDLIVLVTPEYNWLPSAELINMFNHLGSDNHKELFTDKVFAFSGVSTGTGGRLPAVQLSTMVQKIIGFLNLSSVCSPHIFEAQQAASSLTDQGNRNHNEVFNQSLDRFVRNNVDLVSKMNT